MARVKGGTSSINRHKKVLRLAKGYRGRSSKCSSMPKIKRRRRLHNGSR